MLEVFSTSDLVESLCLLNFSPNLIVSASNQYIPSQTSFSFTIYLLPSVQPSHINMHFSTLPLLTLLLAQATAHNAPEKRQWQSIVESATSVAATIGNGYNSIGQSIASSADSVAATAADSATSRASVIVSSANSVAATAGDSATSRASSVVSSALSVASTAADSATMEASSVFCGVVGEFGGE
ncbi:uncharacterized protein LY89DRAFT_721414 [Mollisia scopiformis]|uniref:Uncharacterized protein n=1 Tax=Mollisia scopiformis TaxID=149040 RepID=A0A194WZM1_MOLSC|nr:uncharacterized protein LY89DRAFT_721414 [Mollisia scopiformis]KUJ13390.1 hypothetical protein LY89DRAFT_721414 [Mollisia scopiformis]